LKISRQKIASTTCTSSTILDKEIEDMRVTKVVFTVALCAMFSTAGVTFAQQQQTQSERAGHAEDSVSREVRHQLAMLPRYSVFDILQYTVNGGHITLKGEVTTPVLKSDAEAAVKSVEGVESVDNQIEVLPLSPDDNQIRHAEYRAIYSQPALQIYAEGAMQPIHIIVKNGHVTLVGTVSNETDKNIASVQAKSVPNVFSVTNDLTVGNAS
jgi:osmotically-inducible protein OsmY